MKKTHLSSLSSTASTCISTSYWMVSFDGPGVSNWKSTSGMCWVVMSAALLGKLTMYIYVSVIKYVNYRYWMCYSWSKNRRLHGDALILGCRAVAPSWRGWWGWGRSPQQLLEAEPPVYVLLPVLLYFLDFISNCLYRCSHVLESFEAILGHWFEFCPYIE